MTNINLNGKPQHVVNFFAEIAAQNELIDRNVREAKWARIAEKHIAANKPLMTLAKLVYGDMFQNVVGENDRKTMKSLGLSTLPLFTLNKAGVRIFVYDDCVYLLALCPQQWDNVQRLFNLLSKTGKYNVQGKLVTATSIAHLYYHYMD